FASERIARMKARAVTANAAFVAERGCDSLTKSDAAIFDCVVRVHFEITIATKLQIHDRVLRKEREHVIEERDSGLDRRTALAVQLELNGNARFFCVPFDSRLTHFHSPH